MKNLETVIIKNEIYNVLNKVNATGKLSETHPILLTIKKPKGKIEYFAGLNNNNKAVIFSRAI